MIVRSMSRFSLVDGDACRPDDHHFARLGCTEVCLGLDPRQSLDKPARPGRGRLSVQLDDVDDFCPVPRVDIDDELLLICRTSTPDIGEAVANTRESAP